MVKFTEIINASIEWTAAMLFRPFKPKKWLILTFVALLAGYMAGGGNFNGGNNFKRSKSPVKTSQISPSVIPVESRTSQSLTGESSGMPDFLAGLGGIGLSFFSITLILLIIAMVLVLMWLSSRFNFIFIQNITRNDASIRKPFRENKFIGNSYFKFSLIYSFLSVTTLGGIMLGAIIYAGSRNFFDQGTAAGIKRIVLTFFPIGILFLLLLVIFVAIGFAVHQFVLIIMYKQRIGIKAAWPKFVAIFLKNKSKFIIFFLLYIGLSIGCSIIYGLMSLAAYVSLLWPGVVSGFCVYSIYQFLPGGILQVSFIIIAIIIFLPIFLFFLYCLYALNLPFAVFLRTLGLKFMARLEPELNLFQMKPKLSER